MSSLSAASEREADAVSGNAFPEADGDMEIESGSEDMNEESLPSLEDEQNEPPACGACIDEASAGDEQTPGVGDRLQCDDNEEAAVSASQPHAQQHAPSGERMESEETPLPEEEELAHVLPGRTHAEALLDSEVADRALMILAQPLAA